MKPRIVSTPQRTDGMRWMIKFGWVDQRVADKHMARCRAFGERVGMTIDRDDPFGQGCPLVWTKDLPRAIEVATRLPLTEGRFE